MAMRSGVGGASYWERNGCEQCGAIGAPQRHIGKRYAEVCIYNGAPGTAELSTGGTHNNERARLSTKVGASARQPGPNKCATGNGKRENICVQAGPTAEVLSTPPRRGLAYNRPREDY